MSKLINVLQGIISNTFIDEQLSKDGTKTFKKRIIEISADEGSCVLQFVVSWDFKDCPTVNIGMCVCVQWIIKQSGNQPKKFTTLEIVGLEILADSTQERPEQTPADIYPAGTQLPTPPTMQGGEVKESDFDFSKPA